MPKFIKKVVKKTGAAPGTLVHVGEKKLEKVEISLMQYDTKQVSHRPVENVEALFPLNKTPDTVNWINLYGLHDITVIQALGDQFNIHPLVLEDILNTGQRPKVEEYDNCLFAVLKMLYYSEEDTLVRSEQVSFILGDHFVITFQEVKGDVFAGVRERINSGRPRIRTGGCDYLLYALMDSVVDHYFVILDRIGMNIESIEEMLMDSSDQDILHTIHELKREVIYLRKQVWPLREVINTILKQESNFVKESTHLFFRDVYDHTIQVIDTIESYRDVLQGLLDLYMSNVSNRMNEVMKVLTIIATIFIPITFIAGIYGMNFKYIPELEWKWGYAAVWGVMSGIVLLLLYFFKKNKWL